MVSDIIIKKGKKKRKRKKKLQGKVNEFICYPKAKKQKRTEKFMP